MQKLVLVLVHDTKERPPPPESMVDGDDHVDPS
jgi:hypothetical protein